jgi:hypothetical protein
MYAVLLIVFKVLANALTAASGVYGLLKDFKDEKHQITQAGKVALGGIVLGLVVSFITTYLEVRKAAQDNDIHAIELNKQRAEDKAQASSLEKMVVSENEALQQLMLSSKQLRVKRLPNGQFIVDLSWTPSTSSDTVGYNVYRSLRSGGPYAKINPTPVPNASYVDTTIELLAKYYYVATALDTKGRESDYSNEALANVPLYAK